MSDPRYTPRMVGGQEFPRPMTDAEKQDAALVAEVMPEAGGFNASRGILLWSTGPFWPGQMRRTADKMEKVVPVLRRMADWLDARQPKTEEEL